MFSLLSMYLKIKSLEFEAGLSQKLLGVKLVLMYSILLRRLSYIIRRFQNIYTYSFISLINQIVYRYIFSEYLSLKLVSIQKIGVGAIHSLIYRRSAAFTELVEIILSSFAQKFLLLVLIFCQIGKFVDRKDMVMIIISVLIFSTIIVSIQYMRSYLRPYINSSSEAVNTHKIEILTSYEKEIAYGTLETDLDILYDKLKKNNMYKKIYNISFNLVDLASALFLLFLSKEVWKFAIEGDSTIQEEFGCLVLATEQLKDTLYNLLCDVDSFFLHLTNFNEKLFDINDQEKLNVNVSINDFKDKIAIKNLGIKIKDSYLIKNVTFDILKKTKIAIAGPNGCGKSLFIKSMVGLNIYEGSIKIDHLEVNQTTLSGLSKIITYVSQSIHVFNRTLIQNLKAGGTNKHNDEILDFSKKFNFKKIFDEIGFNKVIGQNGGLISGGQRQRIILMRAILRETEILLLDNVFTGIDEKSEDDFVRNLLTILKDKTIICSIQNPNLLKYFDQIVFFNNGRIEFGTLKELSSISTEFSNFLNLQTSPIK